MEIPAVPIDPTAHVKSRVPWFGPTTRLLCFLWKLLPWPVYPDAGRLAPTTNPDTNLAVPHVALTCAAFDLAFFLLVFRLRKPSPLRDRSTLNFDYSL